MLFFSNHVDFTFPIFDETKLPITLVRFFKEYAPRYGYKYIGIEDNPILNRVLGFQRIQCRGQDNYIIDLVEKTANYA